jgi:hypothetical protein
MVAQCGAVIVAIQFCSALSASVHAAGNVVYYLWTQGTPNDATCLHEYMASQVHYPS